MMLKDVLNRIYRVDDVLMDEYLAQWQDVSFKRKELITREGQVEQYLYFVEEGIQKSYFLRDGKEYVLAFSYTGNFSGSPDSLFTRRPSKTFIECITPSRFLRIRYDLQQEFLEDHSELNTLFRKTTELTFAGVISRYSDLMSMTIEERFLSFAKRSGHLMNLIPHKDLASYLRIDPTNFSKLMNSVRF